MVANNKNIYVIALILIALSFGFAYMTYLVPVRADVKESVISFTGFIENILMLIAGYFFGSSVKKSN